MGKIIYVYFPIPLLLTSGFDHSLLMEYRSCLRGGGIFPAGLYPIVSWGFSHPQYLPLITKLSLRDHFNIWEVEKCLKTSAGPVCIFPQSTVESNRYSDYKYLSFYFVLQIASKALFWKGVMEGAKK